MLLVAASSVATQLRSFWKVKPVPQSGFLVGKLISLNIDTYRANLILVSNDIRFLDRDCIHFSPGYLYITFVCASNNTEFREKIVFMPSVIVINPSIQQI